MDIENQSILQAKSENKTHTPQLLSHGDTVKQLLARRRYLLYKFRAKWTVNPEERAKLLFELYPNIKTAHALSQQLRSIYDTDNDKNVAMLKLAHCYRKVEISGFKDFNVVLNSITLNYLSPLNYFVNRSTNASAESFNAKIKGFGSQFRGGRKIDFL